MGDYWNEDIVRTSVANQKLDIEGEHPAPFPEEIMTSTDTSEFQMKVECGVRPIYGKSGTTGSVCDELERRSLCGI